MGSTFQSHVNPRCSNNSHDTADGCVFAICGGSSGGLTLIPYKLSKSEIHTSCCPSLGEDLSPPNACQAQNLNGVAIPVSASAGWSNSAPRTAAYPSDVAYELKVNSSTRTNDITTEHDSLQLTVTLEYTNPFPLEQSMMVQAKVAKTVVHGDTELAFCATQFQEFITTQNKWVDISAHVHYTEVAQQVVDAILLDSSAGQTAGMATVTAETIDLTLGPFSEKARLILTFQADSLYSYQSMSVAADAADIGSHRLVPIFVTLPFAPLDHEAGLSAVSVQLSAPTGTVVLSDQEAYQHLKQQKAMKSTTIMAISELSPQENDRVGIKLRWGSLPFRSCGVLAWLALPNPIGDDFVHISNDLRPLSIAPPAVCIQIPSQADMMSLQVPLPGHGPIGSLYRVKMTMPKAQSRQRPFFLLNLILSDKSASTSRRDVLGNSMRQRFNELAEIRFLKRLESIPALVTAGVLRLDDVWMDVFLAFDDKAPNSSISRVLFQVKDVIYSVVAVVQAVRSGDEMTASKLPNILRHIQALRSVIPGGATSFSAGPKTIANEYKGWKREAMAMISGHADTCTFVEFDTDGGHNHCDDYLENLKRLCEVCHVKNGVVTGFGSWLDQDCASKVARVFGSIPAQLALHIPKPGDEGLNHVFRRGYSAWVSTLQQPPPFTVQVSAGEVIFSSRTANAIEVLGLRRQGKRCEALPKFGSPDVSNDTHSATVIEEIPAGDELIVYLVSRLESAAKLAELLEIRLTRTGASRTNNARVTMQAETSVGTFIAFDWLNVLSKKKTCRLAPLMSTSLATRLEDEVSFRFNIASPSGRTSYLGRAMTVANRAAIDSAHQPAPPEPPVVIAVTSTSSNRRNGGVRSFGAAFPQASSGSLGSRRYVGASTPTFRAARGTSAFGMASRSGGVFSASDPTRSASSSLLGLSSYRAASKGSGLFGNPSAAPAGDLFSCRSTPICTPWLSAPPRDDGAPNGFGSHTVSLKVLPIGEKPVWMAAMTTPLGSSEPSTYDYDKLKAAMLEIVHCRQRLRHDPSIVHYCDVCGSTIASPRYHCFDCDDFDACANCKDVHQIPFHRVHNVSGGGRAIWPSEDPLVTSLLQSSTPQQALPPYDRTAVLNKLRIKRFLFTVLDWWPIFRASCPFELPAAIPDLLEVQIRRSCSDDGSTLEDFLAVVTVVLDSIAEAGRFC